VFTLKDIIEIIHKSQPEIKKSTIGLQIISDSVNHPSRHHYPGGKDRYWRIEKGKYRLFNPIDDSIN
jgi:hypothetical protein